MADDSQVQNATNPSAQPEPMALPPLLLGTYTPKIDAKGRMALPAKLRSQLGAGLVMARDYANLGDDIVVIGVGTRAEIWNREAWERYLNEKEQGYADIADDVLPVVGF